MGLTFQSPSGSGTPFPGAVCDDMLRPSQLTASVNDYAPPGNELVSSFEVEAAIDLSITGLAGGLDGRTVTILGRGPGTLTLPAENGGSLPENRFIAEVTIAADTAAVLRWSRLVRRWCPIAGTASSSGGGAALSITRATPVNAALLQSIPAAADGVATLYVNASADALIVAVNEDASQTAADRLKLPRPRMFLMPGETWLFVYDATLARHRLVSTSRNPVNLEESSSSVWAQTFNAVNGMVGTDAAPSSSGPAASLGPTAGSGNTNEFTQAQIFAALTGTSAGTAAGPTLNSQGTFLRGSASAYGGFFCYTRVRWPTHQANDSGGLKLGAGGFPAVTNPSAENNSASVAWDLGQATLRVNTRDGAATTSTDLGANFPSNSTTAAYEIVLACANGQARVNYFVRRLDSVVADAIGSHTANLPDGASVLTASLGISNRAAAANCQVQWNTLIAKGGW